MQSPPKGEPRSVEQPTALRLARYAHEPLLSCVWALRDNLIAYDAAYVALAESLEAPLVALDARIAGASGHHAVVEVISG